MCLAIPGQIVRVLPETDLATVDVTGVKRSINIGLLRSEGVAPGDWVLIHVGFAMTKVGEAEARDQLRMLAALGEDEAAIEEVRGYGGHGPDETEGP